MPLTYTPSTEQIAKSYQRTTRMVPNMGVSALTVINPGRPVYEDDLSESSLLTPLTGMSLAGASTGAPKRSSKRRTSRRTLSRNLRRPSSRRNSSRRRSSH
jgi:hypothetical protein